MKKIRIVLFGTGALSKYLTERVKENVEIAAYLTSETTGEVNGKPVISLNQLQDITYDYVVVAFGNTTKGVELLKQENVPEKKIVGYAYSGLDYKNSILQQACSQLVHEKLCDKKIPELFRLPQKKYYVCGMNIPENQKVITRDFVREQTLSLLADEIKRKDIQGSVAEIGVSEGVFARKINALFPDRTLYLFDTYEGLPYKDREKAVKLGWGEKSYALGEQGTQIEDVLEAMPHRERCIIKKGCFPDTFDVEEKFAFVSFDLDFYDSTKRGLELVYPCLSEGGYIMVHDYNNLAFSSEMKDAVGEFCHENGLAGVPIPDAGGTMVLVKNGPVTKEKDCHVGFDEI